MSTDRSDHITIYPILFSANGSGSGTALLGPEFAPRSTHTPDDYNQEQSVGGEPSLETWLSQPLPCGPSPRQLQPGLQLPSAGFRGEA